VTAWEMLVYASGLPDATAWEQLQEIQINRVLIYTEIEASIMPEITATIEQPELIAEIDGEELTAALEQDLGSELE
jgi:hypothetical protein